MRLQLLSAVPGAAPPPPRRTAAAAGAAAAAVNYSTALQADQRCQMEGVPLCTAVGVFLPEVWAREKAECLPGQRVTVKSPLSAGVEGKYMVSSL